MESIDGGAASKLRDLLVALERSYMALDVGVLRKRLSITVTDGAYAGGKRTIGDTTHHICCPTCGGICAALK